MTTVLNKLRSLKHRISGQPRPQTPPLPFPDTLQLETSYRCNLKCFMCPRTFDADVQGMFDLGLFRERVLPILPRFERIHLTGWGEPLMHPEFVRIVQLCKEAGVWTSVTTNGLLLKEPLSRKLLELGIDLIQISNDASHPETFEKIRGKGTYDLLIERMEHVTALRQELHAPTRVEWTFVMMKPNIHELPGAVRLAARFGMDRFTAKHMETAINRGDLVNALWNTGMAPDVESEWVEKLEHYGEEARRAAEETGMDFIFHPRRYAFGPQCISRPVNHIFIDYRGRVSSCCYLNKLDVKPYILAEERPGDDGVMGDLNEAPFEDILHSAPHEAFRRSWQQGQVPEACRHCLQVPRMTTAE